MSADSIDLSSEATHQVSAAFGPLVASNSQNRIKESLGACWELAATAPNPVLSKEAVAVQTPSTHEAPVSPPCQRG